MTYDCYIGIDYGTSTCKLSYVVPPHGKRPVQVEPFAFTVRGTNTSSRFPSCVAFETKRGKTRPLTGFRAARLIEDEDSFQRGNITEVLSPKMDLGKGLVYPFAPLEYSEPLDLCALTLNEMLEEFERTMGFRRNRCQLVVTVPSSFGFDQRKELLGAISSAGVQIGTHALVDEPNAAFLGLLGHPQFNTVLRRAEGGRILLIDFGAGTCDISVLDVEEDPTNEPYGVSVTNLAISDYAELGGNDIDREIARFAALQIIQKQAADLSSPEIDHAEAAESILGKLALLTRSTKEEIVESLARRKEKPKTPQKFKIGVPRTKFPWFWVRAQNIQYGGEVLVTVIDQLLGTWWSNSSRKTLLELIQNVVRKAGLKHENIDAIVLAGGSSRIFSVAEYRDLLLTQFPHLSEAHVVTVQDPDLLISKGAALEAYNRFHLKKSLIRPICPSEVGVLTAEKRNEVLIPAGTPLPYPNQEDKRHERVLYVPNPKPEKLRIPISVRRFGEWVPVESWVVDLPPDYAANEALLFSAEMNLEKVLQIEFRSTSTVGLSYKKETEKWLHGREPTPREARILRMRRDLKACAKAGQDVSFDALWTLIMEEHEAGYSDLVRNRCRYLLTRADLDDARKARVYNYIGLTREGAASDMGLSAYQRAASLHPAAWVYQYNVGVTYLWHTRRFDEAARALGVAAQLSPNNMKAHFHYGEALAKTGRDAESKLAFGRAFDLSKAAFELHPRDADAKRYFRSSCDVLGLEYPERLRAALAEPDEIDIDDANPSLQDNGDIVRSERTEE